MPRPTKPMQVLKAEKKSHKTKAELAVRAHGEEALLTGSPLRASNEVRSNPRALREFKRLQRLLGTIEKDDGLYGNIINRYCLLAAECDELVEAHALIKQRADAVEETSDYLECMKLLYKNDALLQQKRKMMFDIEKENVMTIASALRSIPKTAEKKTNPLLEVLSG